MTFGQGSPSNKQRSLYQELPSQNVLIHVFMNGNYSIMKHNKRGFTLIELLVVIAIIALLMGLLLPALAKALGNARVRKDQGQLKGVASTYSIFAESDKSKSFPKPGIINRAAVNVAGNAFGASYTGPAGNNLQLQGKGPEDYTANVSGWLHSAMIGQRFYEPSILISANENNPMVAAKGDSGANPDETPYDYNAVSPGDDVYWDLNFSGDISGAGIAADEGDNQSARQDVCHTSYANLAICGKRANRWTNGDNHTIILSSRGPQMGENGSGQGGGTGNAEDYNESPTLLLYGATSQWEGIYTGADGSTHFAKSMWFDKVDYTPSDDLIPILDNSFDAEFTDYDNDEPADDAHAGGPSGDTWMVLSVKSTKTDAECYWDSVP
jgi:prepilin-type N-terminal cleavage/methylation domain-containing protein